MFVDLPSAMNERGVWPRPFMVGQLCAVCLAVLDRVLIGNISLRKQCNNMVLFGLAGWGSAAHLTVPGIRGAFSSSNRPLSYLLPSYVSRTSVHNSSNE